MSLIILPTLSLPEPVPEVTSGQLSHYVDTLTVIEHATRRCGKEAASLTAEQLDTAKSNLHLILSSLSNRGVNLWAVDRQLQPLVQGGAMYVLPEGTEKIVNMVYRTPERIVPDATVFSGLSNCSVSTNTAKRFGMIGFKLPEVFNGRLAFDTVDEDGNWQLYHNFNTIELSSGWHWYVLDHSVESRGFRIRDVDGNQLTVSDMMVCSGANDATLAHLNRDQYTSLPSKDRLGKPNSYYFDKQIQPRLFLWPVPQDDAALLIVWRQRRIQDVGGLTQKLEIPDRWFDAVVWTLAKNLAFELPNISETRMNLCIAQSAASTADAELGESDQAPTYIHPNISGYTA